MKTKEDLLKEVSEISKITDFKNLTEVGVERLLKLIGEQRLNEAQIAAIVEIAPQIVSISVATLKTISDTVKEAGDTQKEIIKNIRVSIEGLSKVLSILADKAESDDARIKIADCVLKAGELYIDLTRIQSEINTNNNELWVKIAYATAGFATAITAIIVFSVTNSKNSNN